LILKLNYSGTNARALTSSKFYAKEAKKKVIASHPLSYLIISDVEDLVSTIESVIPIINRMTVQLKNFEKHEINSCLVRLHNSLEAYEEAVVKLDRTGKLMRFLTSSRLRKKIDNLNLDLHKDIEYFVEVIIKVFHCVFIINLKKGRS
jgi:hypothetical protein